jgi:iron(III) transport system ATP-binding protein
VAALTLEALHKRFGAVEVVRGIDLRVPDGGIVALLGGSGSGKTTTLRMVAGLEQPDRGTVRIGDRTVTGGDALVPPEARRISMVFQSYALWPHLTVLQNVTFPLERAGAADAVPRAEATLDRLRLTGLGRRFPHELSGGQQQRVALARALVADPELLLLDEPLSNLDPGLRAEVREEIRSLVARSRLTTVLVTHDREDAFAIADTVALLHAGKVAQHGTPAELYDAPTSDVVVRFFGAEELPAEREGDVVHVGSHVVPVRATTDAPARGPCRLGFRLENAHLTEGDDGIPAEVVSRTYFGAETRCRVRVGAHEIRALGDASPGAQVRVKVRAGFALAPT